MRRAWTVMFVVACACSDSKPTEAPPPEPTPAPSPPEGPIDARIAHYDVDLDLATRVATVKLTIIPRSAGTCVTIPFRATLEHEVTIDGAVATTSVADDALTACSTSRPKDTPIVLATRLTLANKTQVPTQIGFTSGDDFTYLLSWVGGCDLFVPCDSRPDRFATSRFTVHHAPDVVVRCPGTISEVDKTTTVCDFTFAGGPTYSTFAVIAARGWKVTDAGDWSGVRVSIYDLPDTGLARQIKKRAAYYRGFVAFLASNFGAYPYGDTLRILVGPTYWNGFEHPGNIVLSQYVPYSGHGYVDPVAHVLMHEIAHMWAGNQTTIATTHDFVWKEAMVEYLTYVYEDSIDPEVAAASLRAWHLYAESATHYPVPDERPPLVDYYSSAYGPGPMILFRQIERLSSRGQVMAALKSLLGRERAIGVADVHRALEASTGLALDAYFDAWVYGEGKPQWPTFSASYADGRLAVAQTNAVDGGAMPCRFTVALHGRDSDDVVSVAVDTFHDGPNPTIDVSPAPAFDVVRTEIDPDAECLAYPAPVPTVATIPLPESVRSFATMSTEVRAAPHVRLDPPKPAAVVDPWVATPPHNAAPLQRR